MKIGKCLIGMLLALSIGLASSALALAGRAEITRHALAAPAAAERSVASLAAYLAPPSMTEADRAWSLFVWIAHNITYDADAYLAGRGRDAGVTAEEVLRKRLTVCDGFAALYAALATAANLETAIVNGYAKAYGVREFVAFDTVNHAWVAIKHYNVWHTIDPAWGAGYVAEGRYVKQLDTVYFFGQADELKFTHWPVDARWRQAMGLSLSKEQFERLPRVDPGLFRAGVKGAAISATIDDPNFNGLVTVFEQNHRDLKAHTLPLAARLQAGRSYRFRFIAPAFEEISLMHGDGVAKLVENGGVFEGEVKPGPGSMLVGGRPKDGGRLTGLFQYAVD